MGVVRNLRQISADDAGIDIAFRADVHAGLAQRQKAIPARWFYDATGSALFEDITALPEYYPTRSETGLLTRHAADIAAAIGPGIGPCCYEVDAPVLNAIPERSVFHPAKRPDHAMLDLFALNRLQLIGAGVPARAIERVGGCTMCDPELYFSFRRDRIAGRMLHWGRSLIS